MVIRSIKVKRVVNKLQKIEILNEAIISNKKNKIPTKDTLWKIADDMRVRKDDGEFSTYRKAYQWACANYEKKSVGLTVLKLERAYHKALSRGRVGKTALQVSIPLMITNKMRFELSMLGYDKQEMKHLTPEQCWEIINRGVPKKPSRERGRNQ